MSAMTTGSVERNISLSFSFAQAIVDDPAILDEIPNDATVVLIPDDDLSLAALNIDLGMRDVRQGKDVYFRHMTSAAAAL